jgi:Flp pilus assembly protein TadG
MMRRFPTLIRDRDGNVTIEMALLAPVLAMMLIGLVDISTAYSAKLKLEQVAQRSVEKVMQNSFKPADETTLETEAQSAAGTGSVANVTYWLECDHVKMTGASAYTTGCTSGQQYGRYMQIDITKPYTPLIAWTFPGVSNANGTMTVRGIAGTRFQ